MFNPIHQPKEFTPGAWKKYLDKAPADLDWIGFTSRGDALATAINLAQTDTDGGKLEKGAISHVGLIVNMTPARRRILALMGYQVPEAWLGEPCVLEAIGRVSLTPLGAYLEAGRPLVIAHYTGGLEDSRRGRAATIMLNLVGLIYGFALIAAHGIGAAAEWVARLLGKAEAGRDWRYRWVKKVDGAFVCSTLSGIGLQLLGVSIWRNPAKWETLEPLPPKLQTPDDQWDCIRYAVKHPDWTRPAAWELVYSQGLGLSGILDNHNI